MSSATKSLMELLLIIIKLLIKCLDLNSSNSSKPPSQDPNRPKKERRGNDNDKDGQKGHAGTTLEKILEPDESIDLLVKRCDDTIMIYNQSP